MSYNHRTSQTAAPGAAARCGDTKAVHETGKVRQQVRKTKQEAHGPWCSA